MVDAGAYHLAQLRHAYAQLAAGSVVDQRKFADGLIAPAIRHFELVRGESIAETLHRVGYGYPTVTILTDDEEF